MDRETIKAIHDEKFATFLKNINIYDDIQQGACKCKFCKQVVGIDNIYRTGDRSLSRKIINRSSLINHQ